MTQLQTQAEANAYWAQHEEKKWVVEFTRGPQYRRERRVVYVAGRHAEAARRTGVRAMELLGHAWGRSAAATVRLATAQDLGCVYVGKEAGGQP